MSESETETAWWRDRSAILEMIALLAVAAAVGVSLLRGKLEPEQATLMILGGLATISGSVKRIAATKKGDDNGPGQQNG